MYEKIAGGDNQGAHNHDGQHDIPDLFRGFQLIVSINAAATKSDAFGAATARVCVSVGDFGTPVRALRDSH